MALFGDRKESSLHFDPASDLVDPAAYDLYLGKLVRYSAASAFAAFWDGFAFGARSAGGSVSKDDAPPNAVKRGCLKCEFRI